MNTKVIAFSDLHIKEDWEDGITEIKRIISSKIQYNINERQIVVFNGDTLDKPALLGSKASLHLQNLLKYLEEEVSLNAAVIFLQGTLSHDGNWIELMKFNYPAIEFITTIRKMNFCSSEDSVKFLFIPELYNISKEEYSEFLSEEYDYIFGHGTVAGYFTTSHGKEETIERTLLSAPVFNRLDFKAKYTIFGHYHNYCTTELQNTRFFYVGSFFTNTFGEIDPAGKGALVLDGDLIYREPNLLDHEYNEIWIRTLDDISKCIDLQNQNKRVRAIISDDTMNIYIKTVLTSIRNIKDIRTEIDANENLTKTVSFEEFNESGELVSKEIPFAETLFSTYNNDGLKNAILLYANENKFSNIEEKFLSEIEQKL